MKLRIIEGGGTAGPTKVGVGQLTWIKVSAVVLLVAFAAFLTSVALVAFLKQALVLP